MAHPLVQQPRLANELLFKIADLCELEDSLVLCRSNRQMSSVCLRSIYRSITLHNPAQAIACCETLSSKTEAAKAVRILTVTFDPDCALKKISSALLVLSNLQSLDILECRNILQAIPEAVFPQLEHCSLPCAPEVIPFLERHNSLIRLEVSPYGHHSRTFFRFASPISPIPMPRLEQFMGPINVARSLIPGSCTFKLDLYWDSDPTVSGFERLPPTHFQNSIAVVGQVEVIIFRNILPVWDHAILPPIGAHMPHLMELELINPLLDASSDSEAYEFLSAIEVILPSLPNLWDIKIYNGAKFVDWDGTPTSPNEETLIHEFGVARRWIEQSPSLARIFLPSRTSWLCLRGSALVVFPSYPSDSTAKWFLKLVIADGTLATRYTTLLRSFMGDDALGTARRMVENGQDNFAVAVPGGRPDSKWVFSVVPDVT